VQGCSSSTSSAGWSSSSAAGWCTSSAGGRCSRAVWSSSFACSVASRSCSNEEFSPGLIRNAAWSISSGSATTAAVIAADCNSCDRLVHHCIIQRVEEASRVAAAAAVWMSPWSSCSAEGAQVLHSDSVACVSRTCAAVVQHSTHRRHVLAQS
jgi:hypothetical protein